jgi:beta-xylosidase
VVEHDGTYYMISSNQHMSPGMAILESKDLVNWSLIGHVYPKLSWEPAYGPDRMAGTRFGVWAGDLAYHEGRWFCYMIDTKSGLYMTSAPDVRGPWDEPICMLKRQRWTDPAVYWDEDDHQAYLVCNWGKGELRLFKMSWDGKELLDEGREIYRGPKTEAAKIMKIDGLYYVAAIDWLPTDEEPDRKQIMLRSKSIYGPYERKVVMQRGNGFDRSACQGSLLQAPDGSWWYIHQLVQNCPNPFQGRPQCLQPVRWVDGWPIIGEDVNDDGIGEPVWTARKPVAGQPITAPRTDDEFDAPTLGPQWEWNHNPRDDRWSLAERPGWLRLAASVPVGKGGFWGACNTVSQRLMGTGDGTVVAKLDIAGMAPGQQAGFARFSRGYRLLGARRDAEGEKRLFFCDNGEVVDGPALAGDALYIRTVNEGEQAHFAYGVDGKTFERFGPVFTLDFGNWCGDRLGFFCWNDLEPKGHVDIDWFHYDYDGPKGGA